MTRMTVAPTALPKHRNSNSHFWGAGLPCDGAQSTKATLTILEGDAALPGFRRAGLSGVPKQCRHLKALSVSFGLLIAIVLHGIPA